MLAKINCSLAAWNRTSRSWKAVYQDLLNQLGRPLFPQSSGETSLCPIQSISTMSLTSSSTSQLPMKSLKELEKLKLALMVNQLEGECLAMQIGLQPGMRLSTLTSTSGPVEPLNLALTGDTSPCCSTPSHQLCMTMSSNTTRPSQPSLPRHDPFYSTKSSFT